MKRHSGKTTDNINIMYPENPRSLVVTDNNKEHSLGSRLSCSRLVSAAMCVQCPLGMGNVDRYLYHRSLVSVDIQL